jgi:ribosomal protein S18 acetylase RimI-like enzyme
MRPDAPASARIASAADAHVVAALLDQFAAEFGDPTPGRDLVATRVESAIASAQVVALLAGDPPVGVALLTFRPSVWTGAPIATLEDFYVVPQQRGRGHGRSLLREALGVARQRGAASVGLYTGEGDAAARALYAAQGFTNTEPGDATGCCSTTGACSARIPGHRQLPSGYDTPVPRDAASTAATRGAPYRRPSTRKPTARPPTPATRSERTSSAGPRQPPRGEDHRRPGRDAPRRCPPAGCRIARNGL